jgi:hypothetical protein
MSLPPICNLEVQSGYLFHWMIYYDHSDTDASLDVRVDVTSDYF